MFGTKNPVKREELKTIPLMRMAGKFGRRWKGIQHDQFVGTLEESMEDRGWTLIGNKFSVIRDGDLMVGCIDFTLPGFPSTDFGETIRPAIGFINDNGGNLGMRFYAGVIDGDYGIVLCSLPFEHQHSIRLDLSQAFVDLVDHFENIMGKIRRGTQGLGTLSPLDYACILLDAGREGLMPWSRLGKIDELFWTRDNTTRWALLQDFSQVNQMNRLHLQMENAAAFRAIVSPRSL